MKKNILEEKGRADMGKPIVVFGSFAVDLISRTDGMPAPGQTVLGRSFYMAPEGKDRTRPWPLSGQART